MVKKMSNSKIEHVVLSMSAELMNREMAENVEEYKSVTVRLSLYEYGKLKVVSRFLEQSPSGLAKVILTEGIQEALEAIPKAGWVVDMKELYAEALKESETLSEVV
jgi:hypothetical protein